ncbi:MAG: hypothetical protein ABSB42_07515 [Tepidisphaeraceae bacterium]|jgi:hypothetical protein
MSARRTILFSAPLVALFAVGGVLLIHPANGADATQPVATQPGPQQGDQATGSPHLRYDGLYRESPEKTDEGYWHYLRFFPDGTVIDGLPSTIDQPEDVMNLSEEADRIYISRGKVAIQGKYLSCSSTASNGVVGDYTGEIGVDQLHLDSHSQFNGHRESNAYMFVNPDAERALAVRKAAEQAGASLIRMAADKGKIAARNLATDTVAADQLEVDKLAKVVVPEKQVLIIDHPISNGDVLPAMGNANGFQGGGVHTKSVPDPKATAELMAARRSATDKLAADKLAAEMLWAKIGREPTAAEN